MNHIKLLSDEERNEIRIWGDMDRLDFDYFSMTQQERDEFDNKYDANIQAYNEVMLMPK